MMAVIQARNRHRCFRTFSDFRRGGETIRLNRAVASREAGRAPSPLAPNRKKSASMDLIDRRLDRLSQNRFRASFALSDADRAYVHRKGWKTIARHAEEIILTRLAEALPPNDGRQTPWQGHPVFVAQHATATCCRKCVERWHAIPRGRRLSQDEVALLAAVILRWLRRRIGPESDGVAHDSGHPQLLLPLE